LSVRPVGPPDAQGLVFPSFAPSSGVGAAARSVFLPAHRIVPDECSNRAPGRSFLPRLDPVGVGPSVLTNASDLPGYLQAGATAANLELTVGKFLGDIDRSKSAKAGKLVTGVAVQNAKPFRHLNRRFAACMEGSHAVCRCSSYRGIRRRSHRDICGRDRGGGRF